MSSSSANNIDLEGDRNSFPSPWLHWLETCSSTNSWAIDHVLDLNHGDVVYTQRQTAGRGQQQRTWYAPEGGLTASFFVDQVPTAQLSGFSLAAGLAVIQAVETLVPSCQAQLQLKWPNDVWFNRRKLAGILCEAHSRAAWSWVVVGIGLNRCVDFSQTNLMDKAISLHEIAEPVPDSQSLLEQLRYHLLAVSQMVSQTESGLAELLPQLQVRDSLRDRNITLENAGKKFSGRASGIDAYGRLVLRLSEQQTKTFASGHILWAG
jgi:BirA family biotin operon repressor/biotin-[acetyl-CoA-carboxylase] ligase